MYPSLACCAALLAFAQAVQTPAGSEAAALRGCATVRIVVEQSYKETYYDRPVPDVTLPFGEVARALFEGAGLKTVAADDADVVVTIRSAGEDRFQVAESPRLTAWGLTRLCAS